MSRARCYTRLDLLRGAAMRLVDMITGLPYANVLSDADKRREIDEAQKLGVKLPPRPTTEEVPQTEWDIMIARRIKAESASPKERVFTTDLILDEMVHFSIILNANLAVGAHAVAVADAKAEGKTKPKENASNPADALMPLLGKLLPKDQLRLLSLANNLNMLDIIIEKSKARVSQFVAKSKYEIAQVQYAINMLSVAVLAALQELSQQQNYSSSAAVHADSKSQSSTVDVSSTVVVSNKDEAAKEVSAVVQPRLSAAAIEDAKIERILAELGKIETEENYDLTYSDSKYQKLLFSVSAIAGLIGVEPDRPKIAQTVSNQNSVNILPPIPTSATSATSSATTNNSSATAQSSSEKVPLLSKKTAKELERHHGKNKVGALLNMAKAVADREIGAPNELRYHLVWIAVITAMKNTQQRAHNWFPGVFAPSTLRIRLREEMEQLLGKNQQDSLVNFQLYQLYSKNKTMREDVNNFMNTYDHHWPINVTVGLFDKILQETKTVLQNTLLADAFRQFLAVRDQPFRNEVLQELNNRSMLGELLARTYPIRSERNAVIAQLPELKSASKSSLSHK